jgi:hypothetical protein
MFSNLLKAATAIVLTPVTAAVDVVMLPMDAVSDDVDGPAPRTRAMIKAASENIVEAVTPSTDTEK